MGFTPPAVADFKTYFLRDFPYGGTNGDLTTVQDQDITNALTDAAVNFNSCIYPDQTTYQTSYLLLAAHFLVTNLRTSSQGIGGQFAWLQASKGVGSVSESFNIPQMIQDNPFLSMLCKTNYGAKYCMMLIPQLAGQIFISYGGTNA